MVNDDRTEIATTDELETDVATDDEKAIAGPNEVYCMDCGQTIKEAAEICPHCGIKQNKLETGDRADSDSTMTARRQYELESIAGKSTLLGALLGLLAPPVGYVYVGKWGWALVNFLTLNYFLLGFILVPLHILRIISDAKGELRIAGIGSY
ncbi:zinc ribbon domain-containing protein [Halocatena salina]|uniref:Zinc ribbon domain-containing protein n=1 Tax=Halocatena salina TaxID=2934340 RepID=A0A8T9ZZM8_9EURY|nr:zinc ribbon domain-containing protein [Halocatena salina]UPM42224.1 zinc ribbon domain-containing protein [Halocatena salina]